MWERWEWRERRGGRGGTVLEPGKAHRLAGNGGVPKKKREAYCLVLFYKPVMYSAVSNASTCTKSSQTLVLPNTSSPVLFPRTKRDRLSIDSPPFVVA